MTEAPERIFAYRWGLDGSNSGWNAFKPAGVHTCTAAEYVRADLYAALEAQLAEVTRQRDLLAEAIGEAARKAGIYNGEVELTGPHLLMLVDDMAENIVALESTPPAPKVTETAWRTDEPPKDGTPIYKRYVGLFRFLPYKPNSQQYKSGKKGRWQEMNEYGGWENCPTPVGDEWCFDIPNTAAQEAGKP